MLCLCWVFYGLKFENDGGRTHFATYYYVLSSASLHSLAAVIFTHHKVPTAPSHIYPIKNFLAVCQVASSSQLAEARDARSLIYKVKHLEAKLGPLEVHSKDKDSKENVEISNRENCL